MWLKGTQGEIRPEELSLFRRKVLFSWMQANHTPRFLLYLPTSMSKIKALFIGSQELPNLSPPPVFEALPERGGGGGDVHLG